MVDTRFDAVHWRNNILATDGMDFDVDQYVRELPAPEDFNLREKLQEWRETGIVIFERCVDDVVIESFLEDILFLSAYPSEVDLEIEFRGARLRLREMQVSPLSDTGIKFNCIENVSLAARHLSLTRFVSRFLQHVFQDAPAVLQSLTFWRGSEQSAHLDYPYVRTQTRLPHLAASWIPLEDVHPDAGPLAYYPGTHRPGVIEPFDWGGGSLVLESDSKRTPSEFSQHLREQIDKASAKREVFLPKRGDALIWHGNVLHEGTPVNDRSRTRRSYVTHYTSLGSYPRDFMMPNAIESKAFTNQNGGYVFDHPWVEQTRRLPSWAKL